MAHSLAACRLRVLFLVLSTATLSTAASTLDAICAIPSPAPKHLDAASKGDALKLLGLFQLNAGYFFGGEDIHFARDDSNTSSLTRSFSMFPHSVDPTTDHDLLHVAATLALSGGRARSFLTSHGRRRRDVGGHSVTFYLDGYHSSASDELCMTGSGTYPSEDGSIQRLEGVVLKLRIPSRSSSSLSGSDPFVTGRLKGASFGAISLVAHAGGAHHQYDESVSCPTLQPSSTARGVSFSCAHLKEHLAISYKLRYGGGAYASASGSASPLMGLPAGHRYMHVRQVQCTEDGGVRAYAVFSKPDSDDAKLREQQLQLQPDGPYPHLMIGEEVVIAEGRWNSDRSMLCLTACHVVHSVPEETSLAMKECGISMSFWFRGTWTIRDERSVLAGMIWNSSRAAAGSTDGDGSGVISVSSIDYDIRGSNLSGVRYAYNYTMVEEAKKHYLSNPRKKVKGSFVAPNYTAHDFEFRFREANGTEGSGDAYPITIGTAMVYGDRLAADDSFSRHAVADMKEELLNVSYDIHHYVPPAGWVRPSPSEHEWYSVTLESHPIAAEGVFDPKTGAMCLIGCREHNSSTTDCQILITVQLASLNEKTRSHGKGEISSLRNRATDPLFFEKVEFVLYGMYSRQVSESISRMDMESIMLVISTTLPCIFAVMQILHAKRRPEAAAGTSITMLVVLTLGYVAPLVANAEALFLSRRRHYEPFLPFESHLPFELSQAMLRAPTLIALLLQLRLIQLALSARSTDADRSWAKASSAAERRALWLCVPLYLAGGVVTIIVHVMNARDRAARDSLPGVFIPDLGYRPPTLWGDLVSSVGLALDAFLLPQVAMNALSAGAGVRALSPWFYAGGTVVRTMPRVYDLVRDWGYVLSLRPSFIFADPRFDLFGLAWDMVVPCGAALLAVLLFLQQRERVVRLAAAPLFPRVREYKMVSI